MSTLQPDNHPTDAGPFQKYLFSGACYVQIGHCYALVKQALVEGGNLSQDRQLESRLADIWQSYLVQQSAAMSSGYIDLKDSDSDAQQWQWISKLNQEIAQAGAEAMAQLLPVLEQMDAKQLDLQQFFLNWARSCDQAYTRLVRSEVFARAIGEVVNTMLGAAQQD